MERSTLGRRLVPRSALAALISLILATLPGTAADARSAPAERVAAEIVLSPADLGPEYIVAASGVRTVLGYGWFSQTVVRGNPAAATLADSGIEGVQSQVGVMPDAALADNAYGGLVADLFRGAQEVPSSLETDRSRVGFVRGSGPFDIGMQVAIFRAGTVAGYVVVFGYDDPSGAGDAVRLARIMIARAAG
jgi:hypothetical protein